MATLIKELNVTQDHSVRTHLALFAKALRRKFHASTYQGDYVQIENNETYGDRVQAGTTATINGMPFYLVANVLIARKDSGKVQVRVSAWTLADTGDLVGYWPANSRQTQDITSGLYLSPSGLVEKVGRKTYDVSIADTIPAVVTQCLNLAKANLKDGKYGSPVQVTRYAPKFDKYYDTGESHLLPFGGSGAVKELLKAKVHA